MRSFDGKDFHQNIFQRSKSSRHHVFLQDLQLEASGTYRCEVSAEAPSFRTKHEEVCTQAVTSPKGLKWGPNYLLYYNHHLLPYNAIFYLESDGGGGDPQK